MIYESQFLRNQRTMDCLNELANGLNMFLMSPSRLIEFGHKAGLINEEEKASLKSFVGRK